MGLRYENQSPATERHNRIAHFNPNVIGEVQGTRNNPRNIQVALKLMF